MTDEKVKQAFACHNPACTLGSRKEPGRFTGGITPEALNVLTGEPVENIVAEGKYGEGFCPNCGEEGTPIEPNEEEGESGTHDFSSGDRTDPNQDIHDAVVGEIEDAVDAALKDPNDDSVTKENVSEVRAAALSGAQDIVEANIAARNASVANTTVAEAALVRDDEKEDDQ